MRKKVIMYLLLVSALNFTSCGKVDESGGNPAENTQRIQTCMTGDKTKGHSFGEVTWYEPQTCAVEGYWFRTCEVCGISEGGNGVKQPHSWNDGEANIICSWGTILYTCNICEAERKEEVSGSGVHTWEASDIKGYKQCGDCGLYEAE